jgi:hypothetical protein
MGTVFAVSWVSCVIHAMFHSVGAVSTGGAVMRRTRRV